jgi:putative ABC transport system permease protein
MAIGLAATLWLSQFMASLLFGVRQIDPLTYAAAAATLLVTAALACYVPARRVLGVDPVAALRTE